MSEKINYKRIEWYDRELLKSHKVDKVFWLALIPESAPGCSDNFKSYKGINIGISIPHENQEDADDFAKSVFGNDSFQTHGYMKCWLIGSFFEKVTVMIGEGNAYNKNMGTACLFGYFTPDWLAGDERPKMLSEV